MYLLLIITILLIFCPKTHRANKTVISETSNFVNVIIIIIINKVYNDISNNSNNNYYYIEP